MGLTDEQTQAIQRIIECELAAVGNNTPDARQEMWCRVLARLKTFDLTRGRFETFVRMVVKSQVFTLRAPAEEMPFGYDVDDSLSPYVSQVIDSLPEWLYDTAIAVMECRTKRQAAVVLGITPRALYNRLVLLRRIFKEKGLDLYLGG